MTHDSFPNTADATVEVQEKHENIYRRESPLKNIHEGFDDPTQQFSHGGCTVDMLTPF